MNTSSFSAGRDGSDVPRAQSAGIASIAFDLDGPTGSAMLNGSLWDKPGYFGLGAYGPHRAVPRLLKILDGHNIKSTFFTPAWILEKWPKLCQTIHESGHEVAGHGYRHEIFYKMPESEQRELLEQAQGIFHKVLGQRATGFRAPSGDWDQTTPRMLVETGHLYSSSLRGADVPFMHPGLDLVELPAKSLFDDYTAFAYHRKPNFPHGLDRVAHYGDVFDSWATEFLAGADEGATTVTIWHPKVIGTPGRALMLDQFLGELTSAKRLTFRTCHEIAVDSKAAAQL